MTEPTFAPSLFAILVAGLNFIAFILIVLGIVRTIRWLRSVRTLEQRVAALEARLDQPERR